MYNKQNGEYRILIVDDEPLNIEYLFDLLHSLGYKVSVAANGKKSVELTHTIDPSLIIMDWDMPEMDGIDAITEIRSLELLSRVPIIMATGKMLTSEHLKIAIEAGADDFIRKPFDIVEVIARVQSMLRLQEEHQHNVNLEKQLHEQKILQLEQELARNKKELTSSVLKKFQLSSNFEKLERQINSIIEGKESNEDSVLLRQTLLDYKSNIAASNWYEFEEAFVKVHTGFYSKLENDFPDLTSNERKICAFIKLGMSTKQMAAITCQSESALKKARYRLRKKLAISNNINILNFLQSI